MENKLNKLTLNQETVRNLTANEADHVQGGFAIGTRTCAVGCNSQQNLPSQRLFRNLPSLTTTVQARRRFLRCLACSCPQQTAKNFGSQQLPTYPICFLPLHAFYVASLLVQDQMGDLALSISRELYLRVCRLEEKSCFRLGE